MPAEARGEECTSLRPARERGAWAARGGRCGERERRGEGRGRRGDAVKKRRMRRRRERGGVAWCQSVLHVQATPRPGER
jgi:hypothetical protein